MGDKEIQNIIIPIDIKDPNSFIKKIKNIKNVDIIHKIESFCHGELATEDNTNINIIRSRISKYVDPIEPDHKLEKIKIDKNFPDWIIKNKRKFKKWIA